MEQCRQCREASILYFVHACVVVHVYAYSINKNKCVCMRACVRACVRVKDRRVGLYEIATQYINNNPVI